MSSTLRLHELNMNPLTISSLIILSCTCISLHAASAAAKPDLVKREQRKPLVQTEYGDISAVEIISPYTSLQFFTLDPNSLFLPVLLHHDMFFYVHTGSGKLSWTDEDDMREVDISRGDVYTLKSGSVFYVQSSLDPQREKLRFYAFFSISDGYHYQPFIGAYSRLSGMVKGFDGKVLQAAFKVPEGAVEEVTSALRPPAIIHVVPSHTKKASVRVWEKRLMKALLGGRGHMVNSKKKYKPFNVFDAKPDVENCNGWSLSVNKKHLMKGSNVGVFMVNLTKGSMMGPHWNPMATEVSIVLQGEGIVRIACPTDLEDKGCKSRRFKVEEGDVFAVPRFYPMAQISFNNGSFVFMGFSTWAKQNHPQFMAGKSSVLQVLDKGILAASFNVPNTTIGQFVDLQEESIILECTSCAEEEEMKMEEEEARKREEEARKREEEEARKREEEEEEARKREEEEARKREEEEEEEARKREEEEEARKREEEARRKEEEEEARKRGEEARRKEEEEEARKREEEARRKEEEEEARKREEEARRREEARKRDEEEEARKREEEARKREEEEEARKREEEAMRREEEEEARKREEEAMRREEEDEERKREEEEEARKWEEEEEARKREEEVRKREEEARQREEEQEARKREEEVRKWEEEEGARKREQYEEAEAREEEEGPEKEQEAAWSEEEERVQRQRQQEEAWKERVEREKQQQEEEAAAASWQQEEAAAPARIDNVYSAAPRLRALKLSRFMI